jgi:hypothetical protein
LISRVPVEFTWKFACFQSDFRRFDAHQIDDTWQPFFEKLSETGSES